MDCVKYPSTCIGFVSKTYLYNSLCCFCLVGSLFVVRLNLQNLAAVLLKQFIKQHWQEDEENFVLPVVLPEEKVLFLVSFDTLDQDFLQIFHQSTFFKAVYAIIFHYFLYMLFFQLFSQYCY